MKKRGLAWCLIALLICGAFCGCAQKTEAPAEPERQEELPPAPPSDAAPEQEVPPAEAPVQPEPPKQAEKPQEKQPEKPPEQDAPKPAEPAQPAAKEEPAANTCSLAVACQTVWANADKLNPDKAEIVPKNGVILVATNVEFYGKQNGIK